MAAGPTVAAYPEPLANLHNVTSLSLFQSYYFGRYLSELSELLHFIYFERLHVSRCPCPAPCGQKCAYPSNFHSLPTKCPFPLPNNDFMKSPNTKFTFC